MLTSQESQPSVPTSLESQPSVLTSCVLLNLILPTILCANFTLRTHRLVLPRLALHLSAFVQLCLLSGGFEYFAQ